MRFDVRGTGLRVRYTRWSLLSRKYEFHGDLPVSHGYFRSPRAGCYENYCHDFRVCTVLEYLDGRQDIQGILDLDHRRPRLDLYLASARDRSVRPAPGILGQQLQVSSSNKYAALLTIMHNIYFLLHNGNTGYGFHIYTGIRNDKP